MTTILIANKKYQAGCLTVGEIVKCMEAANEIMKASNTGDASATATSLRIMADVVAATLNRSGHNLSIDEVLEIEPLELMQAIAHLVQPSFQGAEIFGRLN